MNEQEHKNRHEELHKKLDELVADFLTLEPDKSLTQTSVMELIEWSFEQTKSPTLPK